MKKLLCATILAAMALFPSLSFALSDDERQAYALLIMGPKENPVQECAVSALEYNLGTMLKRLARTSDGDMYAGMMDGIIDENLKAHRERQFQAWKESRDPGRLAKMNFEYCTGQHKIEADLGALGSTCFSLAGVPALAEAVRLIEYTKEKATTHVVNAYRGQLPEDFVRKVVDDVYAFAGSKDNYKAHRKVFVECLLTVR